MFDGDIYPGDSAFNSEQQIVYGGRSRKCGGDLTTMQVGDPAYNSLQRMVYGGLVSKAALKKAAKAWEKAHRKRGRKGKLPRGVAIGPDGKFISLKRRKGGRIFGGDVNDLSRGIVDMDEIAERSVDLYVKYLKLRRQYVLEGVPIKQQYYVPEIRDVINQAVKLRRSWEKGKAMGLEYLTEPVFVTDTEYQGVLNQVEEFDLVHDLKPSPEVMALRDQAKGNTKALGEALRRGKQAYEAATNPFANLLQRLQKIEEGRPSVTDIVPSSVGPSSNSLVPTNEEDNPINVAPPPPPEGTQAAGIRIRRRHY